MEVYKEKFSIPKYIKFLECGRETEDKGKPARTFYLRLPKKRKEKDMDKRAKALVKCP